MSGKASGKVSVIITSSDEADGIAFAGRMDALLEPLSDEHETVIIANGVSDAIAQAWAKEIHAIPDATVHFLPAKVEQDMATLIGIDNAIGDWVLLCTPEECSPDTIAALLAAAGEGYAHILPETPARQPADGYHFAKRLFFRLYRSLSGLDVEANAPRLRLLSRPAAMWIAGSRNADMLLKSRSLVSGFPSKRIAIPSSPIHDTRSSKEALQKALNAFITSGTAPLRIMTGIALAAAVTSLAYVLYVIWSYAMKDQIAPGWTTLSFEVSGMFFIFSLFFALIGTYLARIDGYLTKRLRYTIVREIRSRQSRHLGLANLYQG